MSLERDLQSKLAVVGCEAITIDQVEEIFSTTVVDTKGFRNFTILIVPSAAIGDTDTMTVVAEDSEDGITFADVPYYKWLPTRNISFTVPDGQPLFNANAPYYYTCGIDNARRYIKVGINCTVFGRQQGLTFQIFVIMEAENQCFIEYDSVTAVPGDNLP
jgi:hypothetical protein